MNKDDLLGGIPVELAPRPPRRRRWVPRETRLLHSMRSRLYEVLRSLEMDDIERAKIDARAALATWESLRELLDDAEE